MTVKETASDNAKLMNTITECGFNGMARIEVRGLLERIIKGRRRIYKDNQSLTQ